MTTMAEKYSLSIENIDQAAKNFIATKSSYSIQIVDKNEGQLKRIEISHHKNVGILNCYIYGGRVSYNIQGDKELHKVCEECWSAIIKETSIPCPDKKTFTAKNIDPDEFDSFIELLLEDSEVEVNTIKVDGNTNIRNQYRLKGKYDAQVSITLYHNGTILLQGAITAFYVKLITEIMEALSSVPNEMIEEFLAIQPSIGEVIELDLKKHFTKIENIEGSILQDFLRTSIILVNSGVAVDDYGCYTFGLMKALDGLISKRLLEDAPNFENYGIYFEKGNNERFRFKKGVITYDDKPVLKRALEKAYNFYYRNRHTTFHIDCRNLETSRILSYDEALNIIKEGLVIMNDICTNW